MPIRASLNKTKSMTTDKELFSHIPSEASLEQQVYQLRADVRELHEIIRQKDAQISSLQTDVQSYRNLARVNQEEADALRRAAGVSCDDTIGEGIAKVAALREKAGI